MMATTHGCLRLQVPHCGQSTGVCGVSSCIQTCMTLISKPLQSDFQVSPNSLRNSNFGFFLEGPDTEYIGQVATTWVLKPPCCHQMITQTHPRGNRKVS